MANEIKLIEGVHYKGMTEQAALNILFPPEYAKALKEQLAKRIVENRRKLEDAKLEKESKDAERW